jgi:hypothetical protein
MAHDHELALGSRTRIRDPSLLLASQTPGYWQTNVDRMMLRSIL